MSGSFQTIAQSIFTKVPFPKCFYTSVVSFIENIYQLNEYTHSSSFLSLTYHIDKILLFNKKKELLLKEKNAETRLAKNANTKIR